MSQVKEGKIKYYGRGEGVVRIEVVGGGRRRKPRGREDGRRRERNQGRVDNRRKEKIGETERVSDGEKWKG